MQNLFTIDELEGKTIGDSFIERVFTHRGFVCIIVLQKLGHRCGYVLLPPKNRYAKQDAFEVDELNCHGGITYSNSLSHFLGESVKDGKYKNYWVIGFDCAHLGDKPDCEAALKIFGKTGPYLEEKIKLMETATSFAGYRNVVRTEEFVKNELINLVEDILKNSVIFLK